MAEAFRRQFFDLNGPKADPALCNFLRHSYEVLLLLLCLDEIWEALHKGSNTSAPGLLGIRYKLLKWAFLANPDYILCIFQSCLNLKHHPWHSSKVIVILKPNKPDYGIAKAYRPISLMECLGKVLEQVIA
jgi:hypothetical protein